MDPIRIWEFHEAPRELQLPFNGGDEDFVIVVPPGQEVPWRLQDLGCCGNDVYRVANDGTIEKRRDFDDAINGWHWEPTEVKIEPPSPYIGCTIVIPSHA